MNWPWPFNKHCHKPENPDYFWKIIHWVYPEDMAAKEGFGIVLDNRQEGKPYWRFKNNLPILGYTSWKENYFAGPHMEMIETFTLKRLQQKDWVKSWHVEEHPSEEIIEGIRYGAYVRNKYKLLDNLSLIEILDKLNEYKQKLVRT
jgi:hypothetical protein